MSSPSPSSLPPSSSYREAAARNKFEQEVAVEEQKLIRALSAIYRDIKRDMSLELTSGKFTWLEVKQIYQKQVDDAIRSAVTAIYEISAKKVAERDIKVPYFLTETDLTEIKLLTTKYQDWVWRLMEKDVTKLQQEELLSQFKSAAVRDDVTGFIGMIAQSINGEAAARAVVANAVSIMADISKIKKADKATLERMLADYDQILGKGSENKEKESKNDQ